MFENSKMAGLAIGRSVIRRRILALLLTEPGTRLHLREIQRRAHTSPGTASRELTKLVSAGLIEREAERNHVYYRGSTSPFAAMLRTLLVTSAARPPDSAVLPDLGTRAAPLPLVAETPPAETLVTATAGDLATPPSAIPPESTTPPVAMDAIANGARPDMMPDQLALVAGRAVAAQMRAIYRERLQGVYLYGRRASGDATPDSDVELLVVLDRVERYGEELDRTSTAIASLSLELGVIVSRVFVSETDWLERTDGQLPGVRAEAVSL